MEPEQTAARRDPAGRGAAGLDPARLAPTGSDAARRDVAGSGVTGSGVAGSDIAGSGVAGSDAERRAMRAHAGELRAGGRAVHGETHWVRPRWEIAYALHAALGVAASVVAVGAPAAGLALALAALASLLLDASGRAFLLRRLTPERATQNVLAPAPARPAPSGPPPSAAADRPAGPRDGGPRSGQAAAPLHVILTAHCDAPRGGLLGQLARGRRPGARLPGPLAWVALALAAVAACAALRLDGAGGDALGAAQLAPTLVLLVALGLLVDAALARPQAADATAPAVVLAAARALDADPPRRVAVDVVLAGAGAAQALGFLAFLRRHRPPREHVAVIEVAPAADAGTTACWWTGDGPLLPLRYHPQLVALAAAAADAERHLGARARRGHGLGAALRARQRRLPAVRIAAPDAAGALALTLALVEALDDDRA